MMPCLNEARTLGACIKKAQLFLKQHGVSGEIIVADNGSTDGSVEIAENLDARVVKAPVRGYGAALAAGAQRRLELGLGVQAATRRLQLARRGVRHHPQEHRKHRYTDQRDRATDEHDARIEHDAARRVRGALTRSRLLDRGRDRQRMAR